MRGAAYEGGRGGHDHATGIKVRLIGGLSASGYPPRQIVAFETAALIPYVYVDDPMANCGARLILERFGSDVYHLKGD